MAAIPIPGMPSIPLPSLTGGAGGAAGPSSSDQWVGGASPMFNSSGWTVATSGSKATGAAAVQLAVWIAGAALVGLILWKKL